METEEKIIRRVSEFGNGAHVFVPKAWANDEITLIRIRKKDIKDQIIDLISPYLDKIIAVFLYGSYARNEQNKNSDIDLFIISSENFSLKKENFEINIVEEDKLNKAKKINPILFYSMIQEAKPIINNNYLEKLKIEKLDRNNFVDFIESTKKMIETNKKKIDKESDSEFVSDSTVYSLILRLRGIFLINCLIKNEQYSSLNFKKWIIKHFSGDFQKVYNIYTSIRDNKKVEESVSLNDAEQLLNLLQIEVEKNDK
jgi:predicted nucleotidyltransferase